MEDGVTKVQSLLPPRNLNPEDGSKREDDKEKEDGYVAKDEGKGSDDSGDGGGVIKNLISSLVTPLSPRTWNWKASTEHDENGNGVFKSEEGTDPTTSDHGERGGVDNGVEGGLISNMISNFFNKSEGEGVVLENEEEKEEVEVTVERIKRVKTEKEANDGGGSIIHNIVSHLPTSLPASNALFSSDDAAPTADEATILINSIVRD